MTFDVSVSSMLKTSSKLERGRTWLSVGEKWINDLVRVRRTLDLRDGCLACDEHEPDDVGLTEEEARSADLREGIVRERSVAKAALGEGGGERTRAERT